MLSRIQTRIERDLDNLAWVQRKTFFVFVFFWGVVQFGLMADGALALLLAISSDSLVQYPQVRLMVLLFPVAGGVWAAVIWISVYFHARKRGD